jgi:DNA-binding winged helix-turn-helix (wHTH) protein
MSALSQLLIDEQIVFDEDSFLLYRADAPEELPLRLGAIASRCLALLLRSGGAVVRKRELMAGAWGQYGLEVTDNSLAQVVRQLRLALDKLHPGREFIQTLPRIGYKLAEGVCITEVHGLAENAEPQINRDLTVDAAPVASPAPVIVDTPNAIDARLETAECSVPPVLLATPRRSSLRRWGLGLVLVMCAGGSFLLGRAWPVSSPADDTLALVSTVTVQGLPVHKLAHGAEMSAAELQSLHQQSQQLARVLGIVQEQTNLYLLPNHRNGQGILCDGLLEQAQSRCVGVQKHD